MIYSVDMQKVTDDIDPEHFVGYLENTGWKKFPTKRADIKVLQLERGDEFYQVTIPLDKGLSDYYEAMFRAVNEVARAESKQVLVWVP